MNPIPQPTSSDEAVVKNRQRQMLIPFVVDKKLCVFHGSLTEPKSSPKVVVAFFCGYASAAPPTFEKSFVLDVRFMEAKAKVFRSMPTSGNK